LEQIDKNADNTNNGLAVSGDAFTEEQAKKAASARRKGKSGIFFWGMRFRVLMERVMKN